MERIHAEDDLLERAGRNGAHEDGVAALQVLVLRRQPPDRAHARREPRDRHHRGRDAARLQRLHEPRLVPAAARAEDRDLHASPREAARISAFTPPRRTTRPDWRLLIVTSAGLKSSLSIL
jgi:hypothetical protein